MRSERATFAARVIDFYRRLRPPGLGSLDVDMLLPHRDAQARAVSEAFYAKFFSDQSPRIFLIGINPGRFGGGTTGIPFTDPVSLERQCGIPNQFPRRRELSAEFFEKLIERWGGPREFYRSFFFSAASPIGFTRGGKNYNYYDNPKLLAVVRPFIVKSLRAQLDFGARRDVAIVLGAGKNFTFLERLNGEQQFFDKLLAVEHPRFIMQYRRPRVTEYLDKYETMLRGVMR